MTADDGRADALGVVRDAVRVVIVERRRVDARRVTRPAGEEPSPSWKGDLAFEDVERLIEIVPVERRPCSSAQLDDGELAAGLFASKQHFGRGVCHEFLSAIGSAEVVEEPQLAHRRAAEVRHSIGAVRAVSGSRVDRKRPRVFLMHVEKRVVPGACASAAFTRCHRGHSEAVIESRARLPTPGEDRSSPSASRVDRSWRGMPRPLRHPGSAAPPTHTQPGSPRPR